MAGGPGRWCALAGHRGRSYLAAAALLGAAACTRGPASVVPAGAFVPMSADAFRAVAARTVPAAPELVAIRWSFDQGDAPVTGRGALRLAPPDSLRLDIGLPVIGRATLVLAGDSTWSKPAQLVEQVAPERALVWALFGMVRLPDDVTAIARGAAADGSALYRLSRADGVVTTLVMRQGALVQATATRGTRTVGWLQLTRGPDGALERAVTVDEEHAARFRVTVDHRETSEPFPPEIWRRP
jgi:hypothetical protein